MSIDADAARRPLRLPRLSGDGVVLRAFTDADVPLVLDAATDPAISAGTTVPTAADAAQARAYIARQHERLRTREGYSFAIADAATDEGLGQIGLWLHDLRHGRASVGYWVAPRHRGRRVAGRALRVASEWGLRLPDVRRLDLYVEPANPASWRTAERVGYRREGLLRSWQPVGQRRRDMYAYGLLPGDGEHRRSDPPVQVLLIGGRSGVGKTAVGDEVSALLQSAGVAHCLVDSDNLDAAHPKPSDDPDGTRLTEDNLAAVWATYARTGQRRLIYVNTVSVLEADLVVRAVGGVADVAAVLLTASDDTVATRLTSRESGTGLARHLQRSARAARELEQRAAPGVLRVSTDGRAVLEIARQVLAISRWTSRADGPGRS